jgi:ribulose-phosphate 3-epimerase
VIAAFILSADFNRLGEEVQAMNTAGADWIRVNNDRWSLCAQHTLGSLIVEAIRSLPGKPLNGNLPKVFNLSVHF